MARYMVRLTGVVRRRRKVVVAIWVLLLLAAVPLAGKQNERLTGGGFEAPGSPSMAVADALERSFPAAGGPSVAVVLVPRPGAAAGDGAAAIRFVEKKAAAIEHLNVDPAAATAAQASVSGAPDKPVVVPLTISGGSTDPIDLGRTLRTALGIKGDQPGRVSNGKVELHVVGQGPLFAAFQEVSKEQLSAAEGRAFPIIALLLILVFGSLVAISLPITLSVATLILSGAMVYLLSLATEMSIFVTSIASLVGLGVAVDYSLFMLARYREEIRAGRGADDALEVTMATSGLAVLFSGLTVIASVAGLFLIRAQALRSMAVGAMVVVALALLGTSTLLPALIKVTGDRVNGPGRIVRALTRRLGRSRSDKAGFWSRWTEAIMSRPVLAVLGCLVVLLTLAAPAVKLNMGNRVLGQLSPSHEFRKGYEAASSVVGPGALSPLQIVATFPSGVAASPENGQASDALRSTISQDPQVLDVGPAVVAEDGRSELITVILRSDPESQAARNAVTRLRAALAPSRASIHAEVGGTTAQLVDFDSFVRRSMWKILLFVSTIAFVVLVVFLRSIVLPFKAVLMNLLSVAATYGVLVAVFQWGWLEFLGLHPAPYIDTITPPLVLVIAYGLSMDYEVFLLSRIRERHDATGDNRRAVAEGLASSAGTITSAAAVMVVVFLAFVSAGTPAVQRIGLALAAAIIIDATLVRLVLVPAAMELLDEWNWWLPRPLARLLPEHIEPSPLPVAAGSDP